MIATIVGSSVFAVTAILSVVFFKCASLKHKEKQKDVPMKTVGELKVVQVEKTDNANHIKFVDYDVEEYGHDSYEAKFDDFN